MTEQEGSAMKVSSEHQQPITAHDRDPHGAERLQEEQDRRRRAGGGIQEGVGGPRAEVGERASDAQRIARAELAVLRAAVVERKKEREILARLEQQNDSVWRRLKSTFGFEGVRDAEAKRELEQQRAHYKDAVNLVHAIRAERIIGASPEEQKKMQEVITRDIFHEADRLYNAKTEAKAQQLGIGVHMAPIGRFFQREDVRALCKKSAKVAAVGGVAIAIAAGGVMTALRQAPKLAILMGAKGPLVMTMAKAAGMMSVAGGATVGGFAGHWAADRYGKRRLHQDKTTTQSSLVQGDAATFLDTDVSTIITQREQLRRKAARNTKIATVAGAAAGGALGYMSSGYISHDASEYVSGSANDTQGDPDVSKEQGDVSQKSSSVQPVEQPDQNNAQKEVSPTSEAQKSVSAPEHTAAETKSAVAPKEVVFDIKSGDTMWGRIKEHLSQTYGDDFDQLSPQQKNIAIDHFEDQLQALEANQDYGKLKEMGFGVLKRVGHEDVDYIRPGDRITMTEILGDDAEVRRVLAAAGANHNVAAATTPGIPPVPQASAGAPEVSAEQVAKGGVAPQAEQAAQPSVDSRWAHAPRSISIPEAHDMSGGITQEAFASMLGNDAAWHIAQTEQLSAKNAFDTWLIDVSHMEGMAPQQGETLEQYIVRYNKLYEQQHTITPVSDPSAPEGNVSPSSVSATTEQASASPGASEQYSALRYATLAHEEFRSAQPSALFLGESSLVQPQFFGFGEDATQFHHFLENTRATDLIAQTQNAMETGAWENLAVEERRGRAWMILAKDIVPPHENETMSQYIERFLDNPEGQVFEYVRLSTVASHDVEVMTQQLNSVLFGEHIAPTDERSAQSAQTFFVASRQDAIMQAVRKIGIEQPGDEGVYRLVQRIIGSGRAQLVINHFSI